MIYLTMSIFPEYFLQIEELTGLNNQHVILTEEALLNLNRSYCRESGVRNLKKHIEKIYRKAAFKVSNSWKGFLEKS